MVKEAVNFWLKSERMPDHFWYFATSLTLPTLPSTRSPFWNVWVSTIIARCPGVKSQGQTFLPPKGLLCLLSLWQFNVVWFDLHQSVFLILSLVSSPVQKCWHESPLPKGWKAPWNLAQEGTLEPWPLPSTRKWRKPSLNDDSCPWTAMWKSSLGFHFLHKLAFLIVKHLQFNGFLSVGESWGWEVRLHLRGVSEECWQFFSV